MTVKRILLFQMSGYPGTRKLGTGYYCFRCHDARGQGDCAQDLIVSDIRMPRDEKTVDRILLFQMSECPGQGDCGQDLIVSDGRMPLNKETVDQILLFQMSGCLGTKTLWT